ncbi:uncharacterized protein B0H64DRAFT_448322 [Chaetomium fimeti]|uniref:Uncharacterized protein n=1 Tax=Chaetomium fimeti TaxID=1854472 RepID=A0AAE0LWQ2_9PEZI|nr:hypothetical protein B0H64DRAFT_448322 [Chaetomium fimeti]
MATDTSSNLDYSSNQDYPTPEPSSPPPVPAQRGIEELLGFPEFPSVRHGSRIRVDGAFVQFLIDYAANDPECPPQFKAFLEEVVLKPGTPDLRPSVETHLRNPQIKNYGLGPNFVREFEKYEIYDQVFPQAEDQDVLPFTPIPEGYQPRATLDLGPQMETILQPPEGMDSILGDDTEDFSDFSGLNTEGAFSDMEEARLDTVIKFLAEEDVDRCMGWEPKFEEIVSYLEWLDLEDDRSQLFLASPQTQAMFNDAVTKAKAHVLFEKHHYDPTPLEFTKPPKSPFRSTRLSWMVNARDWPLPPHNPPPPPDRSNLLPRPILPHTPGPVNSMLVDQPENSLLHGKLAEDQREWWARIIDERLDTIPPGAEDVMERLNLGYIEDHAFATFSRQGTNTGTWVTTDATGATILPNDKKVRPGIPLDWVQERAARRAALQQTLHALPTTPPTPTPTTTTTTTRSHSRLIFPTPAAVLRQTCTLADQPAWTPPQLPASQLPPDLETMPHTVAYRARLASLKKRRELARMRVEEEHEADTSWAALPRNVVSGGPFVWRILDAEGQKDEDLLRGCWVAVEVLRAAARREPRGLVEGVVGLVERGVGGEFVNGPPEGVVVLAGDEWEVVGGERVPRLLELEEVEWLKFLGGQCVSGGNWERRAMPDTPKDKYRLFQLFATKVKKLLDDRNPQGLFSSHNANVGVEDLLKVINAGKDSSAVTKQEVKPHDACKWLDRMKQNGLLRFHLDPTCYGIVRRPVSNFFPEHRVVWPAPTDSRERPSLQVGYVADWDRIISGGEAPDISEGSTIWNFFMSLAFRLGYTISILERDRQTQQAVPARQLRDSIRAWTRTCARLEHPPTPTTPGETTTGETTTTAPTEPPLTPTTMSTPEPTARELSLLRTHLINELHANASMLAPGREQHYFDATGARQTILVRDHNWDWAAIPPLTAGAAASKGAKQTRRQRQREKQQKKQSQRRQFCGRCGGDVFADPAVGYEAGAEDRTTEGRYLRPKLRPYREEKVVFRAGPAVYPVGDTRLQREVLRERMVGMVERAAGLEPEEPTWGEALVARLNPFSRPWLGAEDREEEGKLPPVKPGAVPKSWDPVAEAERRAAERRAAEEGTDSGYETPEEGVEEEDEVESVDVAMTGMGRPWIAV